MKPDIIIFLKRIVLFILLFIAADQALGFLLEHIYFNQEKGQFAQTTYSVDRTHEDILVFGSSRAVRHYSPAILSKAFNMSCYNVGRDAQMIPYYTAIQDVIFNRYKPKIILLDVNSWELAPGESKYEKLSILLPYCREHPELVKYINQSSKWEKIKMFSRTYPYNSSLFILGYNYLFANRIPADEHGYAPLIGEMTDAMLEDHKRRMASGEEAKNDNSRDIDKKSLAYYEQFLAKTAKAGIKTYVIISPKILNENINYRVEKLIEVAGRFKNVKFINFSNDPRYNYRYEKFADVFHLNKQGSEEFTNDLIPLLK